MLSDREKQELKEMGASAILRGEFRTLRKNSQAIEGCVGVDELAHWLTEMARICPGEPNSRRRLRYPDARL